MGNVYRFTEPVVLYLLKKNGRSYGYELARELADYALTDAEVELAALYRTLQRLEQNGYVASEWDTSGSGPARHLYRLTTEGEKHLEEWRQVLERLAEAMSNLVEKIRAVEEPAPAR